MFFQSTALNAISRRLKIGFALVLATLAIAGTAASSAMAGTSHGCLQYSDGTLCAQDSDSYYGYQFATATFSDGSQLVLYIPNEKWNQLVDQATGTVTVTLWQTYTVYESYTVYG
jgi:hypothetical protein